MAFPCCDRHLVNDYRKFENVPFLFLLVPQDASKYSSKVDESDTSLLRHVTDLILKKGRRKNLEVFFFIDLYGTEVAFSVYQKKEEGDFLVVYKLKCISKEVLSYSLNGQACCISVWVDIGNLLSTLFTPCCLGQYVDRNWMWLKPKEKATTHHFVWRRDCNATTIAIPQFASCSTPYAYQTSKVDNLWYITCRQPPMLQPEKMSLQEVHSFVQRWSYPHFMDLICCFCISSQFEGRPELPWKLRFALLGNLMHSYSVSCNTWLSLKVVATTIL